MEVLLLVLAVAGLFYAYIKAHQSKRLQDELNHLEPMLRSALIDLERELADHKESVQELAVIRAKLEGFKASTLTPDNSVPKSLHMEKVIELCNEVAGLKASLEDMTGKFEESRGKQKSEQVRIGMIGEQFACLHTNFKYDRKETKALLQPVDFVCFEENEVVFVDVKTGNSQLSSKQRKIRDNIKAGRVKFEVFRINEDGATWEE